MLAYLFLISTSLLCARAQFRDEILCLQPPFGSDDNDNWEIGGSAKVLDDSVQLTANFPGRLGTLWSKVPLKLTDWKVTIKFQITGEQNTGGEGFAFWYVQRKTMGSVFGAGDYWDGLGIFFDTAGAGLDIPAIVAIYNDGTQRYNAYDNGISQALGKCNFPIRNSEVPLYAEIIYLNEELSVNLALDFFLDGSPNYLSCFKAYDIRLGLDKFFGFTSITPASRGTNGATGDKHEIYSIVTMNYNPVPSEDQLENRREEYRREVEEEHRQVPQHHHISETEFHTNVLSLLNQIQNQLEMLDQSQIAIENLLQSTIEETSNQGTSYFLGQEIKDHISEAFKAQQTSYTEKVTSQKEKNEGTKNNKQATAIKDVMQHMSDQLLKINDLLASIQTNKKDLLSDTKSSSDSSRNNAENTLLDMNDKLDTVFKIPDMLRTFTKENMPDQKGGVGWTVFFILLFNLAGIVFLIGTHFYDSQGHNKFR